LLVDRRIRVRELDQAQAPPLAVDPAQTFPEASVSLQSGDTLILYTDGIIEAVNPAGERYGRDRLLSCVKEDVPNAQHIVDCVVNKLIGFTGGHSHEDDQTLLAIRIA
jgi:sigma-B regulation protein RsbU (phosphoserine phosphatase)